MFQEEAGIPQNSRWVSGPPKSETSGKVCTISSLHDEALGFGANATLPHVPPCPALRSHYSECESRAPWSYQGPGAGTGFSSSKYEPNSVATF